MGERHQEPGRLRRRSALALIALLGLALIASAAALAAAPQPAPLRPRPVIVITHLPATAAGVVPARPTPSPAALPAALASATPAATASAGATAAAASLVNGQPYSLPTPEPRMLIPSLKLDESVLTIPVVDGNWDLSQLDTHIGWLTTTGSRPGDALAMAFIGHYTVTATRPGALAELWKTHLGDEVIYRAGGVDYVYAIQAKITVGPNDVAQLYVHDGQQLLLVTCTDWNYLQFKYDNRLIVKAQLQRQQPAPGAHP